MTPTRIATLLKPSMGFNLFEADSLPSDHDNLLSPSDLDEVEKLKFIDGNTKDSSRHTCSFIQPCKFIFIHVSVILLYTMAFWYAWKTTETRCLAGEKLEHVFCKCPVRDSQQHCDWAYAAPDIGKYVSVTFAHQHSVYVGHPTDELDRAWHELLRSEFGSWP